MVLGSVGRQLIDYDRNYSFVHQSRSMRDYILSASCDPCFHRAQKA